ncbi:longitudinals lacking protein, isoforms H/M/V isoform X3 [Phymastichus coffea]|uniref:longitudinals lacking protein, isoforms H/M/V isoform X3 n=1 Tax=Phymastichus coffea TaxID=108790 RepID=UPI00273B6CCB|nr:longitudinals lacking protein, isoforms H/M/V isoform X3 [Phymastichus coffea]
MEDDQQFCLRWNNHQSTLIQNFDTLLESGTLVDCTLAAEGKYLKAHKVVLSACSPYFEGLLSEHYDKHPVFILKDVKFKELKAMMDYMYRGEVNISQDQLTALLKAAESLQIKGLSDSKTGGSTSTTGKSSSDSAPTRQTKSTAGQAAATAAPVDIPHTSSGLTIEKNKVPRQSLQQAPVCDLPEDSASPQCKGLSSREGSTSPTRKRKRQRRRSLGNDDNSMENHEASNSSDANLSVPPVGVAAVAEDKTHADQAVPVGRSALMQQLTKPADEMIQIPMEKPEPNEEIIQPKSEYLDDQESVEDLTHLDDDMNDMEMDQDSRPGPSTQDGSQHPGMAHWHMAGDRSNTSVGAAAGAPGVNDEVFLAAQEAAQAQRDSQVAEMQSTIVIKEEPSYYSQCVIKEEPEDLSIRVLDVTSISLQEMEKLSRGHNILENPVALIKRRLRQNLLQRMSVDEIKPFFADLAEAKPFSDTETEAKFELPRPSNAVATVLQEQKPDYMFQNLFNGCDDHQKLLTPQKVLNVNEYLKRKRGRPRKNREIIEIYPKLNGNITKRKRGRPRKSEVKDRIESPIVQTVEITKKPDSHYFREEILMTRLRNKRL